MSYTLNNKHLNRIYLNRIDYRGDIREVLNSVCTEYKLGNLQNYEILTVGYEDLNIVVTTSRGRYVVKIFRQSKKLNVARRNSQLLESVIKAGINHPTLRRQNSKSLYVGKFGKSKVRLIVMDYVKAKSFYDLKQAPTDKEVAKIATLAAKIDQLDIKPTYYYDECAVVNLVKETKLKSECLSISDSQLIRQAADRIAKIKTKQLPQSFIHGDLLSTNVLKDNKGRLSIIDYSVANIYPRIQELAVLFCDLFFDIHKPEKFPKTLALALSEYQKINPLTAEEITALPSFIIGAHAINLLIGRFEYKYRKNHTRENKYFINKGRVALRYCLKLFKV